MNTHTHQKTPRATRTSNHECGTVTTIYKIYKTCWSCLHSKLLRSAATQAAAECPSPLLLRVSDPLREARKLLLLLDEAQLMGHWVIETGFASPRVCDAQDSFQPYDKHSGSSQFTSLIPWRILHAVAKRRKRTGQADNLLEYKQFCRFVISCVIWGAPKLNWVARLVQQTSECEGLVQQSRTLKRVSLFSYVTV